MDKLLKLPSWKNCSCQVLTIDLKHSVLSECMMYAAYHTKLGGTSSPDLNNVHSKNFRCPFSSSMAFWSVIVSLQSCQVGAFLECAVLSFLDLPDSFWSAWGRWLDKVAVKVHPDLKLMSLSTAALADCSVHAQGSSSSLLVAYPTELGWKQDFVFWERSQRWKLELHGKENRSFWHLRMG